MPRRREPRVPTTPHTWRPVEREPAPATCPKPYRGPHNRCAHQTPLPPGYVVCAGDPGCPYRIPAHYAAAGHTHCPWHAELAVAANLRVRFEELMA